MPTDMGISKQHQSLPDYFASFCVTVIIVNYLYCVVIHSDEGSLV